MATALHNLSDYDPAAVPSAKGMKFGIVVSEWNHNITGTLLQGAHDTLLKQGVKEEDIYLRSRDKVPDFYDFCKRHSLKPEEVAFVGDDLPDVPILKICGLAVCPADAVAEVKEVCDYISLYNGGKGCVRDLIEQVLKIQGKWVFDPVAYSG